MRVANPMSREPLNVLVASFNQYFTLPYQWAVLKTYAETDPTLRERLRWLEPLDERVIDAERWGVEHLVARYRQQRVDVLGLSLYVWSSPLLLRFAEEIRRDHPDCLVVAGGPDAPHRAETFLARHPAVDVVVKQDGEIAFRDLLVSRSSDSSSFAQIPGLVVRDSIRGALDTGKTALPKPLGPSPWLMQREALERRARDLRAARHDLTIVFETNRGCPYGCTFCDWGSSTLSKIRTVDDDRLAREIEWLGAVEVDTIWIADANFGILPRDAEIAARLADVHARCGWPRQVNLFPAKNRAQGVLAATRPLIRAGLMREFAIGVQSTDPTTLKTIARRNMGVGEQSALVESLTAEGIAVEAQLIIGCPGDTIGRWRRTLADVMESGLHSELWIFWFEVLANAPANQADYRAAHALETRVRVPEGGGPARPVVCASATFTRRDYVEMHALGAAIRALHYGGTTRFLVLYLRFARGIAFEDFYAVVLEELLSPTAMFALLRATIEGFFFGDDAPEGPLVVPYEEAGLTIALAPTAFINVSLLRAADDFYAKLRALVRRHWGEGDPILEDLVSYQQRMMITLDYDRRKGRHFAVQHDWPAWFRTCERHWTRPNERLADPTPTPGAVVIADDRGAGTWGDGPLDWHEGSRPGSSLARFVEHASSRELRYRNYFRSVRIEGGT